MPTRRIPKTPRARAATATPRSVAQRAARGANATEARTASEAERAVCQRFHQAIELIGRRWTGAILHILLQGPARFSVIGATLPEMTDRMLSERLRELEAAGLVVRTVVPSVPVRVEYGLTEKARDLTPALEELAAWAHRWLPAPAGEDDAAARPGHRHAAHPPSH